MTHRSLFAAGLVAAMAGPASAAVVGIDSVSLSPAPTADPLRVNATIDSITLGGNTFSDLESITSVDFPANRERLWATDGTDPGSDSAAIVGLDYGTSVLNLEANTDLNFGRTLAATERVFLIKDGLANSSEASPDRLTLLALAGNTVIGDYSINLDDSDYGATLPLGVTLQREGGASDLVDRDRVGVSFLVSDLTGTTGDLSTLTGFRVSATGNEAGRYDLAAVGVVIPEPGSIALLGLGAACLLGRRRA